MQSLCLKAFGWHVGRLYQISLAEKKVRLACNLELEFACVQENGKFQSFRCSDTEIELEIAGEQLK